MLTAKYSFWGNKKTILTAIYIKATVHCHLSHHTSCRPTVKQSPHRLPQFIRRMRESSFRALKGILLSRSNSLFLCPSRLMYETRDSSSICLINIFTPLMSRNKNYLLMAELHTTIQHLYFVHQENSVYFLSCPSLSRELQIELVNFDWIELEIKGFR